MGRRKKIQPTEFVAKEDGVYKPRMETLLFSHFSEEDTGPENSNDLLTAWLCSDCAKRFPKECLFEMGVEYFSVDDTLLTEEELPEGKQPKDYVEDYEPFTCSFGNCENLAKYEMVVGEISKPTIEEIRRRELFQRILDKHEEERASNG